MSSPLRAWLADARRGRPWWVRPGREVVPIGPLISPLRYDILVRQRYFEYFAERRADYERDFDAYERSTRRHAYFIYFRDVTCRTWFPEALSDDAALDRRWRWRLERSAALYDSFMERGFDERFPITLHAGARVAAGPNGKRVSHRLFAGDGNHRLALLVASGRTELQPSQYRVRRYPRLAPSDTTPYCLSLLRVAPGEYADFLRRGYPGVPLAVHEGRPVVEDPHAPLAEEVRRVIDIDTRWMREETR